MRTKTSTYVLLRMKKGLIVLFEQQHKSFALTTSARQRVINNSRKCTESQTPDNAFKLYQTSHHSCNEENCCHRSFKWYRRKKERRNALPLLRSIGRPHVDCTHANCMILHCAEWFYAYAWNSATASRPCTRSNYIGSDFHGKSF